MRISATMPQEEVCANASIRLNKRMKLTILILLVCKNTKKEN